MLERVRGDVVRPLGWGLGVGLVVWALGMQPSSALLLAAVVATAAVVLQRVDGEPEPRPPAPEVERAEGARGEVSTLAWSMVGRDGRAGERALRRLREAAASRLRRHGLDLDEDDAAVRALLGARAHTTLTRRTHPLPSVGDLTHTLGVLERLGTHRDHDVAAPPPTQDPPAPTVRTPR